MTIRIRRRSAAIGLSALTLSGGLMACEPKVAEQPMKVYASAADCQVGGADWNTCNTSAKTAQAEHEKTAPRFNSREECLRETDGDCNERREGGHSVFLPIMAGFMLGRMMSGPGYASHPVYTGRDGLYSGGSRVGDTVGARGLPRQVSAPMTSDGRVAQSSNARRGGFGRTSSYRGTSG